MRSRFPMSTLSNAPSLSQWPGYSHWRRQFPVVAALVFATALCLALLGLRTWRYGVLQSWLIWNLFLAWLPLLGALAAYNLQHGLQHRQRRWLPVSVFAVLWLLFLPNATYLVTDIIHLKPRNGVPLWYDLIVLVSFAWTGVFLGLVSLFLMQEMVRRFAGRAASWLFVFGVMVLNGFGLYFGRVLRWNSWDVLFRPGNLFFELLDGVRDPWAHTQTLAFAGLFTLLFSAVYLMLLAFTQLQLEQQQKS
ncbi:MAG: DUF1361 domain-containing protein [Acidobacteria bacterium]|nr:DUF1361 domain-containing protein [Acidobacteriota bacterium]MBI3428352.1 DUF1361 domain-containing protein [Acidobacteriota bacterium]